MAEDFVIQNLEAIKSLIEQGWTQEVWARNAHGVPTNPHSLEAACFCLYGALKRVANQNQRVENDLYRLIGRYALEGLVHFNDNPTRTKKEVLELLDKIIKTELEAQQDFIADLCRSGLFAHH